MIKVENLVCGYNNNKVLDGISFELKDKEFLGIIGPNGSGKTTLLRTLTNAVPLSSGLILYKEKNILEFSNIELAKEIAFVRQTIEIRTQITVEDFVLLGRSPYMKKWQFFESKEDIKFAEYAMNVTDVLSLRKRDVNTLSGGERQLVVVARALAQKTKILILDEPTNHLDISHQVIILDLIKRLNSEFGITIITALHDLNLASEYCDRIILINNGKIYSSGKASEVLTYQNIENVYKTPVIVKENPISKTPHIFLLSQQNMKRSKIKS